MFNSEKLSFSWPHLDRQRMLNNADYLAIALAFSLPLSTSATAILSLLWLLVLAPTLRVSEVRRQIMTFEGGLPVLLFSVALLGMLWADVAWHDRVAGLRPFLKLLAIPLLFVQFQRSDRGEYLAYAIVAGSALLMLASFVSALLDRSLLPGKPVGIVVKDYISQSGFFLVSIFLLLELIERSWSSRKVALVFAQASLIIGFLIGIFFVATSRTTLLVFPILLFLFGLRRNWKIAVGACAIWAVLFLSTWHFSPYLKRRLQSASSISASDDRLDAISNRQRIAYWLASLDLIRDAPLLGHGTGSIPSLFRHYTADGPNSDVNQATNPHNETFRIALQFGGLGTLVLYGMWFAHARMLARPGFAAWFGLTVLTQNFFGSLFNSHLSDFTQGWTYAICIGVAGGMVKRINELDSVKSMLPPEEPAGRVANSAGVPL
jgi:O-antigen ligase